MQTLNIDFVNKKISGTSKYLKDIYNDEEQAKYILTDIKVKQEHHVAKK